VIARKRLALHRPGTATQQKGLARLLSILEAARNIFMEQGYSSLTMRKVATRANISIGNLNYYYRTKEDLLRDLIDYTIIPYLEEFDRARKQAGESPEKQTTAFFPECWALANHNAFVADLMDDMYSRAREPLNELIGQINPTFTRKESEQLALYMCATMEGLTIFAGHGKPWSRKLGNLRKTTIDNFMDIIKSTRGSRRAS